MCPRSILLALLLALPAFAPSPAHACAPAPPPGTFVAIAAERAIIVWDEAHETEHFIRSAALSSDAADFGFLVPTPSKPELAEADGVAFDRIESTLRRDVVNETSGIDPTPLVLAFFARGAKSAAVPAAAVPDAVRVLEEKTVGGYDAVVLEADDPGALAEWLKAHGYANRPALAEWLRPYVDQKWKLTAFKIARAKVPGLAPTATGPVRMSFATKRPFFPYREPRDQRESIPPSMSGARSLRVAFIGRARATATIGDGATRFPGKATWAIPLEASAAAGLPGVPADAWLTVFEDDASPRPGVDELWFAPSPDKGVVKPEPIRVGKPLWIPLDVLGLVVGGGFGLYRRARKKKSDVTAASRSG